MQNTIQKIRQSSTVFEKPGILPENLKLLTSSNYPTVQHFLLKLRTLILLTEENMGFFLFYLDLELFSKIKKIPGFYPLVFCTFVNNSRSKQNKKNPTQSFIDITKYKTCAKFQ